MHHPGLAETVGGLQYGANQQWPIYRGRLTDIDWTSDMPQAKGVLPRSDDKEVLYKNPQMCGYFWGVTLQQGLTADSLTQWLGTVSAAIDTLVVRGKPSKAFPKGPKHAAVAVGLAASFFEKWTAAGRALETPVGLRPDTKPEGSDWFAGATPAGVDVVFYVAAVMETRVNEFVAAMNVPGVVASVTLERGAQRSDETEAFGYRDGVRNMARSERPRSVFVYTDGGQPDEPAWADGGTYMVTMKIPQLPATFRGIGDQVAQDRVIGRRQDGSRIDLPQGTDPHSEPNDVPGPELPASSHVRKVGPRGRHDDTHIFRRGLPYLEVVGGQVQVGLQFCSFQANPYQFDTIFNDWMRNHRFPQTADTAPGQDALMTSGALGPISNAGLFFVPPYHPEGLLASITPVGQGKPRVARLAIQKHVVNRSDPSLRFERGGFRFHVIDSVTEAVVDGSEFVTQSSGRGVCHAALMIGKQYTLVELESPHANLDTLARTAFTPESPNVHLRVVNELVGPIGPYGPV